MLVVSSNQFSKFFWIFSMNIWVFLFCLILVGIMYLNFLEEIKVGKDLEILEMDYINNSYLQETCRTKQPVYFLLKNGIALPDSHHLCTFQLAEFASKYGKEKVVAYESLNSSSAEVTLSQFIEERDERCQKIGEEKEEKEEKKEEPKQEVDNVPLWSENNSVLIEETPLKRYFKYCDAFLAPFGTVYTEYDFWLGSTGSTIPVRHHRHHSYYLFVMNGEISVKLAPFKFGVVGQAVLKNDYMIMDPPILAKQVEDAVPWMEVIVSTGYCLLIPPYWWHQTTFTDSETQVAVFMYDNVMNTIVNWGDLFTLSRNFWQSGRS